MEPTAQDRAHDAEQQESYARTMRQHWERNWIAATDADIDEYWTMKNAAPVMRKHLYNPDRAS